MNSDWLELTRKHDFWTSNSSFWNFNSSFESRNRRTFFPACLIGNTKYERGLHRNSGNYLHVTHVTPNLFAFWAGISIKPCIKMKHSKSIIFHWICKKRAVYMYLFDIKNSIKKSIKNRSKIDTLVHTISSRRIIEKLDIFDIKNTFLYLCAIKVVKTLTQLHCKIFKNLKNILFRNRLFKSYQNFKIWNQSKIILKIIQKRDHFFDHFLTFKKFKKFWKVLLMYDHFFFSKSDFFIFSFYKFIFVNKFLT